MSKLVKFAAGRGHSEFPCLSRAYSPGSRIPCADFSPLLCEFIAANDFERVADFVWEIVRANPGLVTGRGGHEVLRLHWRKRTIELLQFPIEKVVRIDSERGRIELRAALVHCMLHSNFSGFLLSHHGNDDGRYLATVMLPHGYRMPDPAKMAERANDFIVSMRLENPNWDDIAFIEAGELIASRERPEDHREFLRALLLLSPHTRLHLFDAWRWIGRSSKPIKRELGVMTCYGSRRRGLDEMESVSAILASNMVTQERVFNRFFFESLEWAIAEIESTRVTFQVWIATSL